MQFFRILAREIVDARVRWIAFERAVVRDELAVRGVLREHFRNRSRVAGPDEAAGQRDAERRARRVMTRRKHVEPDVAMPEPSRQRNQRERVPEIRAALGDHFRIVRDARLQQRHQRRMRVEPHRSAQPRVEVDLVEQPLEPADVIHVRVRDVDRTRRLAVVVEERGQCFLAAVDHQHRLAVVLEHAAGRAELRGRLRAADAEEAQSPAHRPAPRTVCATGRTVRPA